VKPWQIDFPRLPSAEALGIIDLLAVFQVGQVRPCHYIYFRLGPTSLTDLHTTYSIPLPVYISTSLTAGFLVGEAVDALDRTLLVRRRNPGRGFHNRGCSGNGLMVELECYDCGKYPDSGLNLVAKTRTGQKARPRRISNKPSYRVKKDKSRYSAVNPMK